MIFQKETNTRDIQIQTKILQQTVNKDFSPIGLDQPYWIIVGNNPVGWVDPYGLFGWDTVGRWIGKKIIDQIKKIPGKQITNKIMPDKGLNMPYEGDDDNDGSLNFMDPDSEYCQVNCTRPEPSGCK